MTPGTLLKTDKCTIAVETAPLDAPDAAALYPWKFALSRPDQHVLGEVMRCHLIRSC